MPSLGGATAWLGSEPLDSAELRGRVVLVNFWTWTCINWLRQVPYVRSWSRAYRDDGLLVVGVHTPEFSFERDVDGVRRAMAERRQGDFEKRVKEQIKAEKKQRGRRKASGASDTPSEPAA